MSAQDVQPALAALGNRTRLAIVTELAAAGRIGRLPSQLADTVGIPRNLLSAHMLVLDRAGFLEIEERGRNRIVRLAAGRLDDVSMTLARLADNSRREQGT